VRGGEGGGKRVGGGHLGGGKRGGGREEGGGCREGEGGRGGSHQRIRAVIWLAEKGKVLRIYIGH
jgi:hypothetical protein